jgi:arginase
VTGLTGAVEIRLAAEQRPTVVAGDCLTALATLTGVQRAGHAVAVVWFDAHGDVHTLASSTSGHLGGTALRTLLDGDPDRLSGPLGTQPLPEHRAVLVDARDLDPAEAEFLATSRLRRVPVEEVGAELFPDGPLLVHVDLDVIDAAEVPGLRLPVPCGPGLDTVIAPAARNAR